MFFKHKAFKSKSIDVADMDWVRIRGSHAFPPIHYISVMLAMDGMHLQLGWPKDNGIWATLICRKRGFSKLFYS